VQKHRDRGEEEAQDGLHCSHCAAPCHGWVVGGMAVWGDHGGEVWANEGEGWEGVGITGTVVCMSGSGVAEWEKLMQRYLTQARGWQLPYYYFHQDHGPIQ
jgi:hypothetical protein